MVDLYPAEQLRDVKSTGTELASRNYLALKKSYSCLTLNFRRIEMIRTAIVSFFLRAQRYQIDVNMHLSGLDPST